MQELNLSPNNFERCLKCNVCTQVCPMLAVNPDYPGPKQAGPDGERYRLKDPAYYDLTLRFCLNCKRCEMACPSGVRVGDIIQTARLKYGKKKNVLRDFFLSSTDTVGRLAVPLSSAVNGALEFRPVRTLMNSVLGVDSERVFPTYAPESFVRWFRTEAPSQNDYERRVGFFHGCYVNYNYPQLGKDFVRLMNACGYGVRLLATEKCCGVPLISNGFGSRARRNARTNVRAVEDALSKGCEAVLASSSTCAFTVRDEYANLLGIAASACRDGFLLAVKWLYDKVERGEVSLKFRSGISMRVAYHTACHMDKLGWSVYSMALLRMVPGLELVELDHECCGMAGTFGFKTENRGFSRKIGERLFDSIRKSGCQIVATDCETCKWQIETFAGVKVMNPVSILASTLDCD